MDAHTVKSGPAASGTDDLLNPPNRQAEQAEGTERRSALQDGKPKVLLIDDRPANLLAYRVILEDLDIELFFGHSGQDALAELRTHDFAVFLLDVNMPGMDGFETAKAIRETEKQAHTPIIF